MGEKASREEAAREGESERAPSGSRRRGLSQEARGEERCRTLKRKRTHVRAGLEREERKPFDEDTKHSVMNHLAQTRCVGSISATSSVATAPRVQSLAGCPGEKLEPFGFPKNRCRWQLRDR